MDTKIETTQQARGEHHLTEGDTASSVPATQYGSETSGAPGPVTQPIKGEITQIDGLQTSQQKAGEFSLCEGQ